MSRYWDGIEEMLADERGYERELDAERLERLERADTLAPLGLTISPAASAGVVAAGNKSRRVSSDDDEFTPTALNPAEASSKGHASQPGDGFTDREVA